MESVASLTQSPVSEVLTLARRFEPVVRYTEGELFLPMPVERYVEAAALFRRRQGQKTPELVAPATTKINLSTLVSYAGHGDGTDLELHFVDKPLSRAAYRRWLNSSTEHTRLSTRGLDRTAAPIWPGTTSSRCLPLPWRS